MYFFIKVLLSAVIIASVTEIAKHNKLLAAFITSLPLISIMAFCWIYYESRSAGAIITLSYDIFWLVIPSLTFFIFLPLLLKNGLSFILSMILSSIGMVICYQITIYLKHYFVK